MQKALELPTNGFFVYNLGGANYNGNDLPVSVYSYGSACIYKRNSESIFVFLTGIANSSTPLAANWYNGASWTGWKTYVTNTDLITKSLGSENLNNIKGSGWHCQTHTANATTERNYPIEEAGFLLVTPIIDSSFILQQYTASITNATYKRVYQQGVWRNWQQL